MRAAGLAMPALLPASACSEPIPVRIEPDDVIENWSEYIPRQFAERGGICGIKTLLRPAPLFPAADATFLFEPHRRAQEPVLHIRKTGQSTTLRLSLSTAFKKPVIFRLEGHKGRSESLSATRLNGAGEFDPGFVDRRVWRRLTTEESATISNSLSKARMHDEPEVLSADENFVYASLWVIELFDDAGFHIVVRLSPQHEPVRELGEMLIGLTGWDVRDVF